MNKKLTPLLHVAAWVALFLWPLSFLSHAENIHAGQYLMMSIAPLTTMIVFYVNYLWLTPRHFVSGEKRVYWTVNIIMIVALGIALHYWMAYAHSLIGDNHPHHEPTPLDVVLFILRDIFQLTIAAAIATTIQLAMRWQHAETARKEAELKNLRWQMNPHFLLNTLNNIYALTAIDTQRAQNAIQELSTLMRHVLYDNQQPLVPLDAEVQFLQNYISLMKIRLPQSVDVQFLVQTPKSKVEVAPLIFISLVENAFKHGVSPIEPSYINIRLTADEQHIVCDIRNSNHPKAESDRSGHGIGLRQVQQRLALTYPGRYQWQHGVSEDGKEYHSQITLNV